MKESLIILIGILFLGATAQYAREDNVCSDVPEGETILFPYPYNCSMYYRCDGKNQELDTCPDGLYFNNNLQSCDYPESAGCQVSTTTQGPTNDPRCLDDGTDYFPHPTDCSKYIECYEGTSTEMSCPEGLWFNADSKKCVMPEESGCSDGGSTTTPKTTTPSTTTSSPMTPTWTTPDPICWGVRPGETVLRPYEGDCNKYWECYGSQKTLMSCPPYLYFSEERQLCDWPELTNCTYTTTSNPNPTTNPSPPTTPDGDDDPRCVDQSISYWPHPVDCTKYIECYKGEGYEMDCPNGLYFDSVSHMCTNPSDSDCGKGNTTTSDRPTETTTKTSGQTDDPDCAGSEYHKIPYPGDCTKYYECDHGQKVEMNCPSGLYFNPTLLICDYPYQAGCEWAKWSDYLAWMFRF